MSFENLSEVLWSTPGGGTSILGLFDHRNTTLSSSLFLDSSNSISHFSGDGGGGGGPQHNYAAGISIAVATSIIQSLGLTLQRKSHVLNEAIHPKELRRTACQQPLWHFGFYTYILSNIIGTLFSIGYLPVIILAPLGAVTLVFNAVFARLFLGDVFSRQSVLGKAPPPSLSTLFIPSPFSLLLARSLHHVMLCQVIIDIPVFISGGTTIIQQVHWLKRMFEPSTPPFI
jgi:hypothetical protein